MRLLEARLSRNGLTVSLAVQPIVESMSVVEGKNPTYLEKKRLICEERHKRRRDVFNRNKWLYLLRHPCIDCGETDPVVLDFDHRDPQTKRFTIAGGRKGPWEEVLQEIQKCDVRCANCHRRKTAKQLGWYPGLT